MRDRYFMEDENELPYMLWEVRDENDFSNDNTEYLDNEEKLDRIMKSISCLHPKG